MVVAGMRSLATQTGLSLANLEALYSASKRATGGST